MSKILIVYYSRTGVTKKVAELLREKMDCDIEEIISVKDRSGIMGYMFSGKEATMKTPAEIKPAVKNPADYDLVILGTPVWAWNISSPMRAYLLQNKEKFKKIAGFCTMGGDGDKQSFSEITNICGKELVAKLALKTKEVQGEDLDSKIESFLIELINLNKTHGHNII